MPVDEIIFEVIKLTKVFLANPLAEIKGKHIHFHRDFCAAESSAATIYPPLDLAYVAAFLKKKGIDVTLVDASVLHIPHKELLEKIKDYDPDYIGIPSAWGSFEDDLRLAAMIRSTLPVTKIIFSGPHVTLAPEIALNSGQVDYVVCGELELPYYNLITTEKNNLESVPNIAFKKNQKIIRTNRELLDDLDSLPFPARELLPNEKYKTPQAKRNPSTMMFTSRGCPFKCTYCTSHIWYMRKARLRSAENVVLELEKIVNKYKIHEVFIRDETFTLSKKRVKSICDGIIGSDLDISWSCLARVDTIDSELLNLMKASGCYQIGYGFESGSQRVLDRNKKGTTLKQAINAAKLTKAAKIELAGSFMFGMLGDNKRSMQDTMKFALELDPDFAQFTIATPYPGTEFFDICKHEGYLKTNQNDTLRLYDSCSIEYPEVSKELLFDNLKKAYRKFYYRPKYLSSRLNKVNNFKQLMEQAKVGVSLWNRFR